MKITIMRTNGVTETVDGQFADIEKLIGASILDTVNLRDGRIMLVDDLGYETVTVQHPPGSMLDFHIELKPVRARKPVNEKATMLYHSICVPGTTHQIVGDVAIIFDGDIE